MYFENVPLLEFITLRMYLWWNLCTLYLLACQVRVSVGNSGLFRAIVNKGSVNL